MRLTTALVASALLLTACGTQDAALRPASSSTPDAVVAVPPTAAPDVEPASPPESDTPAPAPATDRPDNALDWDAPAVVEEGLDLAVTYAWADLHDVRPDRVRGEQLLLGAADRGALVVGVYQLWVDGGRAHVVVAQAEPRSEAVVVRDSLAEPGLGHVDGVVSRTEPEVVVALAPGTERLDYRSGASAPWEEVELDGLDVVLPRAASPQQGEALRTTRAGRTTATPLWTGPADEAGRPDGGPVNLLGWPARGPQERGADLEALRRAYEQEVGGGTASVARLASGDTDGGVRFVLAQAWVAGRPAQVVARIERPGREPELHVQPATPPRARVTGLLVTDQPGTTSDLLVLVAEPRTVELAHRTSSEQEWQALELRDGMAYVDRAPGRSEGTVRLVRGSEPAATTVLEVRDVLCPGC